MDYEALCLLTNRYTPPVDLETYFIENELLQPWSYAATVEPPPDPRTYFIENELLQPRPIAATMALTPPPPLYHISEIQHRQRLDVPNCCCSGVIIPNNEANAHFPRITDHDFIIKDPNFICHMKHDNVIEVDDCCDTIDDDSNFHSFMREDEVIIIYDSDEDSSRVDEKEGDGVPNVSQRPSVIHWAP